MTRDSDTDLFQQYLGICNSAITANKEAFPIKQIVNALENKELQPQVEVCIIDDNPQTSFTIGLAENEIRLKPKQKCQSCICAKKWRISKSYLMNVISNPETYIKNPALLNWEWLEKR